MGQKTLVGQRKISKEDFVSGVVNKPLKLSNKVLASQMNISEQHFYNLMKKYSEDIEAELGHQKTQLRVKSMRVLSHLLDLGDATTAYFVIKQFGLSDNTNQLETGFNVKLAAIAELLVTGSKNE